MLVELVEVNWESFAGEYKLQLEEVYINPEQIISIRRDTRAESLLQEGALPSELNASHSFSRIAVRSGSRPREIRVIGTPAQIVEKCRSSKKILLKG